VDAEVGALVRICGAEKYDASALESHCTDLGHALTVHDDIKFDDGQVPDNATIGRWLDLIESIATSTKSTVGVHCVSGLGRAPVLVAVAVWTYSEDKEPLEIVEWLRSYRKGALNRKQLVWFEQDFTKRMRKDASKRRHRLLKMSALQSSPSSKCIVM
jgi:protein tyrosine phosphatase type 4A